MGGRETFLKEQVVNIYTPSVELCTSAFKEKLSHVQAGGGANIWATEIEKPKINCMANMLEVILDMIRTTLNG